MLGLYPAFEYSREPYTPDRAINLLVYFKCCAPRASDRELARAVSQATGERLHHETVKALLSRYFFWCRPEFRGLDNYPVPADPPPQDVPAPRQSEKSTKSSISSSPSSSLRRSIHGLSRNAVRLLRQSLLKSLSNVVERVVIGGVLFQYLGERDGREVWDYDLQVFDGQQREWAHHLLIDPSPRDLGPEDSPRPSRRSPAGRGRPISRGHLNGYFGVEYLTVALAGGGQL
jgi:hypothetical protein